MKILAIDSSAVTASCAVTEDDVILSQSFVNIGLTHSQTLMPLIDATLSAAQCSMNDIDLLAVSNGPGSFTGVRIGVATIKGIAFTHNLSCVGVSTLQAIAYACAFTDGIICAVMDARRNQVYCALFRAVKGNITRLTEDDALSIDVLGLMLSEYNEPICIAGDGAQICYSALSEDNSNLRLAASVSRYQSGAGVAFAAAQAFSDGTTVTADKLAPTYLRLPQAERELKSNKN